MDCPYSDELNLADHFAWFHHLVEQHEGCNEISDGPRALFAIGDAGMLLPFVVQAKEIAIVRHQHSAFGVSVHEVFLVGRMKQPCLRTREDVDPPTPQCLCHRIWDMLVELKPDSIHAGRGLAFPAAG